LADATDVILAIGSVSLVAARRAAPTLPIVALDWKPTDRHRGGAKPEPSGRQCDGNFLDAPEIAGKWIQIIREIVPRARKVALLFDNASGPDTAQIR